MSQSCIATVGNSIKVGKKKVVNHFQFSKLQNSRLHQNTSKKKINEKLNLWGEGRLLKREKKTSCNQKNHMRLK